MTTVSEFSRRDFLRATVVAGAGLSIVFSLPGCSPAAERRTATAGSGDGFQPNVFVRIGPDGIVTMTVNQSEMGQGVLTSIPMLFAEELDADWSKVQLVQAPAGKEFANPAFGAQLTGGSSAVRGSFMPFRQMGAVARGMLVAAAAKDWGVDPSTLTTESGTVIHAASGKRADYGSLASKAASMPVPEKPVLKDPKDFRLIGKPTRRLDLTGKVNGSGVFGVDVKVPGMLYGSVARSPVYGGKLKSLDAAKAKAVPGVKAVETISNGVVVIADSYWQARQGRNALAIVWDEGPTAAISSAGITKMFRDALDQPATSEGKKEGDVEAALAGAAKKIEAEYEVPFLAHACMEPMNATAHVTKDGCTVWAPTQWQSGGPNGGCAGIAASAAGCPTDKVVVHTTLLGGGFGRRAEHDFVLDAVEASKAVGAPVKVIWSREEDIQHDFFRPASLNRMSAGLDAVGAIVAYRHKAASPSLAASHEGFMGPFQGVDPMMLEGSDNMAYSTGSRLASWHRSEPGVPVGFWRSVGSSNNAFVVESFIDELAHAAGKDPFEFRRALLKDAPRHRGVLELAAEKAGWGTPLPAGRARGIAVAESFASYVAQVAEVSVSGGKVRVHRVVCAIDCGMVVNPDTVAAQMEGGIVYGLTAALSGEITIDRGRAVQTNFDRYPMLRLSEMPVVETHIMPSTEAPGGVGEPGTPPIAPAVTNALFALIGKRIRKLPIRLV